MRSIGKARQNCTHSHPLIESELTETRKAVSCRYVWGNYIDELLVINDDAGDDSDYVLCHDHLYSAQALLSKADGSIAERYDYDAYGKPYAYTSDGGDGDWWDGDESSSSVSAKGLVYLFTGREFEIAGSLSLQYSRARYLNVHMFGPNRWMQRDPLGYVDGMSVYEYVRTMPVNHADPFGLVTPGPCMRGCHGEDPPGGPILPPPMPPSPPKPPNHFNSESECQQALAKADPSYRVPKVASVETIVDKTQTMILVSAAVLQNAAIETIVMSYDKDGGRINVSIAIAVFQTWDLPTGHPKYPTIRWAALSAKYPHRGQIDMDYADCIPRKCVCESDSIWRMQNDETKKKRVKRYLRIKPKGVLTLRNDKGRHEATINSIVMKTDYDVDCNETGSRIVSMPGAVLILGDVDLVDFMK